VRPGAFLRAARRPRAAPLRGFTLVEILVVVVIMAVLTTVAMLSIGTLGKDRGLDDEGDRYTDVAAAVTEQAQLEGRDFGVYFGPASYEVLVYVPRHQRWETLPDDRLYEKRELPAGVAPTLEIEGKVLLLDREKAGEPHAPQVLIFSSGDVSPYRLTLAREGTDAKWQLEGRADGTLLVTRPGAAP
jgi:general secretion pathway protein H